MHLIMYNVHQAALAFLTLLKERGEGIINPLDLLINKHERKKEHYRTGRGGEENNAGIRHIRIFLCHVRCMRLVYEMVRFLSFVLPLPHSFLLSC